MKPLILCAYLSKIDMNLVLNSLLSTRSTPLVDRGFAAPMPDNIFSTHASIAAFSNMRDSKCVDTCICNVVAMINILDVFADVGDIL